MRGHDAPAGGDVGGREVDFTALPREGDLLGGRLGDLFGHRKLFLGGIVLFTLASLGCGLANSQELLVIMRAVQGVGGA